MISPTFNHMYALSCSVFLWRFAILWIVAHHAPLSMQFPRQKQWSGQPFPSLGYLPNPGIKPASPVSSVMATEFFTAEPPGKLFNHTMKMKVLVSQLCLTLCNPMECSLAGSSVHGILQARIVEWLPFPSLGDLPYPGIEPESPALQVSSLPSEPLGKPFINDISFSSFFPVFIRSRHWWAHLFTWGIPLTTCYLRVQRLIWVSKSQNILSSLLI